MRKKRVIRLLILLLAALAGSSLLLGKFGLTVTRYELSFRNLPESFDGFRVVQLSDWHGAQFGEDSSRLIERVRREDPDIIALTGDFLDRRHGEEAFKKLPPLLDGLCSIAPVYFVSGNHDWDSGLMKEFTALLSESGVTYLRNSCVELERNGGRIVLAGLEDPNGRRDMPTPDEVTEQIAETHPGEFVLLLAHRNNLFEHYPDIQADLILAGHAHGGIVRLPFIGGLLGNNYTLFPRYDAGLFTSGRATLILSRGLGGNVPIPRFMNTPEIVSVTLRSGE